MKATEMGTVGTFGNSKIAVSYPMREDVKRKTLPFSLQGGGSLTCIQPYAVG
jgi:hypothetical protein